MPPVAALKDTAPKRAVRKAVGLKDMVDHRRPAATVLIFGRKEIVVLKLAELKDVFPKDVARQCAAPKVAVWMDAVLIAADPKPVSLAAMARVKVLAIGSRRQARAKTVVATRSRVNRVAAKKSPRASRRRPSNCRKLAKPARPSISTSSSNSSSY